MDITQKSTNWSLNTVSKYPFQGLLLKYTSSDSCNDGMYRSESMTDCEDCTGGNETNAEKSECGKGKTYILPEKYWQ